MSPQYNTDNKIRSFLINQRDDMTNTRNDLNEKIGDLQIKRIKDTRDLLKSIALISVAILGFLPHLYEESFIIYLIISGILYGFVILFIISLIKSDISKDQEDLKEQKAKYNLYLKEAIDITDNYLKKENLNTEDLNNYFHKLKESDSNKSLEEENRQIIKRWKEPSQKEKSYAGGFVLFFFMIASLFAFLSVLGRIHTLILIILITILFFLSITDWSRKLVDSFSKFVNFLNNLIMSLSKKQIYIAAFILIVATTAGLFGVFNSKINKSLKTYTNNEYGFSFQYPENVTVYEKGDKEFYPPSEDKIIAWGETDETFPNPVRGNSTVPYRISILEGRHPFEIKNYERVTTFKEKDGEIFTIRYGGPATAITTNPIPVIKNAYEIISESFEIN